MKISLNLFRTIEWYNKFLYRDRETMKPFFGKFDLAKEIFLSCKFQNPHHYAVQNIHVIVTLIFSLIL